MTDFDRINANYIKLGSDFNTGSMSIINGDGGKGGLYLTGYGVITISGSGHIDGRLEVFSKDNIKGLNLTGDGRITLGGNGLDGVLEILDKNNFYIVRLEGNRSLTLWSTLNVISSPHKISVGNNELFFQDNGQIRSLDNNHRILFRRSENKMELREFGDIILSPGATEGIETAKTVFLENGNVGIGKTDPKARLDVGGDIRVNDNNIWLRGNTDNNHGIAYNANIDGPMIFGNNGGALGTTANEELKTALSWDTDGNVSVSGDVLLYGGEDCAEDFDIVSEENVSPGTVMVINDDGALKPSQKAYDKCVAGVISGAGELKPGITLGKKSSCVNRRSIALVGKAYCKVDADYSSIEVGDLLTTSSTIGHAMKAKDHLMAFGSVIGKALRPLKSGRGLIPILIALQ